jgi:hypothetical protein
MAALQSHPISFNSRQHAFRDTDYCLYFFSLLLQYSNLKIRQLSITLIGLYSELMIPKAGEDEIGTKPGIENGSSDRSGDVDQRSFLPPDFERIRRIAKTFFEHSRPETTFRTRFVYKKIRNGGKKLCQLYRYNVRIQY